MGILIKKGKKRKEKKATTKPLTNIYKFKHKHVTEKSENYKIKLRNKRYYDRNWILPTIWLQEEYEWESIQRTMQDLNSNRQQMDLYDMDNITKIA